MDIAEALSFASTTANGVLVTNKRDGRPQLSNVTFGITDGVVRVSITANRAKYLNLRRDPRASLYVTRPDFGAYAVIEGDVTLSGVAAAPDDAAVEELVDVYRSIVGEHPDWDEYRAVMVSDGRAVVRLTPTHAYGMISR